MFAVGVEPPTSSEATFPARLHRFFRSTCGRSAASRHFRLFMAGWVIPGLVNKPKNCLETIGKCGFNGIYS